jgi:oligogalacturonide lyase
VQLTEGAGDNTFGGFLSPDDKSFYYVKNDRTLLEVNLHTLAEREVYRVSDDWVGYGTWVANSDCTKLVGIEIAKSDWTPLNDWKIFHDFFHKGPHCRLLRVDLKTGESSTIHEEKTGWAPYLSSVRRQHRRLLPRRAARPGGCPHVAGQRRWQQRA